MKNFKRILSVLLCGLFVLGAVSFPAVADTTDNAYREHLISIGFPADYADELAKLHTLHPSWNFTPLLVTELNSKYTWDYVLYMETEDEPNRSLVPISSSYSPYHHKTNKELYDAGYYQASAEAVAYFMDPRNFLNEKDIFQFEDLSYNSAVTLAQVESSLAGTFMENAWLENGKTYAEYFIEVGRELGISPIHLASRARQEQGNRGSSSQISGLAGNKLWYYYSEKVQYEDNKFVNTPSTGYLEEDLKAFNGLYNMYNINATGSGRFPILLNGMTAAKKGTPEMAESWGGDPAWNTMWKAIYGGAYKLCNSYIGNYQNTLYLQKWNVDNRSLSKTGISKNFWGQYMQNIDAALLEARTTYNALSGNECLDCSYNFLIPVYKGMPKAASPDPANGSFAYYAVSSGKYSYINTLTLASEFTVQNKYISELYSISQENGLEFSGHSVHSYGVTAFEYSIDGADWIKMSASYDKQIADMYPTFIPTNNTAAVNSFSAAIDPSALTPGNHKIAVRARADYNKELANIDVTYYLVAVIDLEVEAQSRPTVTIISPDGTRTSTVRHGDLYSLPQASELKNATFVGWKVTSNTATMLLPADASLTVLGDVTLTPVGISLELLDGAAVKLDLNNTTLRFTTAVEAESLIAVTDIVGAQNVKHGMIFCESSYAETLTPAVLFKIGHGYTRDASLSANSTADTFCFDCDTNIISAANYKTSYSASGYIDITYTNGTTSRFFTDFSFNDNSRSVNYVATAALADTSIAYGSANIKILTEMTK